jgi:hypothetical protein
MLARLLPWIFIAFFALSAVDLEIAIFGYNPSLLNALAPFLAFGFPLLIVISGLAYDFHGQRGILSRR